MRLAIQALKSLTVRRTVFVSNTNSQIARQIYRKRDYKSLYNFYKENHKLIENDHCVVDLMRQVVSVGYRYRQGYNTISELVHVCALNLHTVYSYNDVLMFASVVAHHEDQRDEVWKPILKEIERVVPSLPAKGVRNFVKVLTFLKNKRNYKDQYNKLEQLFIERLISAQYINDVLLNEKLHILGMIINKPQYIDFTDKLKALINKEITTHPVLLRFYVNLLYPQHGITEDSFIEPEMWAKIEKSVREYPKDWYFINFVR